MSSEDGESKPASQEVVLDKESENSLISRISQTVRESMKADSKSTTESNLSDEEVEALTTVIDEHVDKRVQERLQGEGKSTESTEETRKRIDETVKEVVANRRQGLSEVLRIKYEAERERAKKQ